MKSTTIRFFPSFFGIDVHIWINKKYIPKFSIMIFDLLENIALSQFDAITWNKKINGKFHKLYRLYSILKRVY